MIGNQNFLNETMPYQTVELSTKPIAKNFTFRTILNFEDSSTDS